MTLKWVPVGANREISYALNDYQYVVRRDGDEHTLVQRTKWGEICRHKTCDTKQDAEELAEQWAAESKITPPVVVPNPSPFHP
jgi:hypothetical protein